MSTIFETKTYDPVGCCIYCGARDRPLTDEHCLPFALAANYAVLPKSSCQACAKITGAFEQTVCRGILGPIRTKLNYPTRRNKDRATALPFHVMVADNKFQTLMLPIAQHPTSFILYRFTEARLLAGLPEPAPPTFNVTMWQYPPRTELEKLRRRFGGKGLQVGQFVPTPFVRMLAKIGHSIAVAELGRSAFKPLAIDLILGRSTNMLYLVGGSLTDPPPTAEESNVIRFETVAVDGRGYLVVYIRLFANLGAPEYHAVIGAL